MGYELHIIRKSDYENYEEDSSISFEEWLKLVENDSELKLTDDGDSAEEKGFCLWNGHSKYKDDEGPWFDYYKGTIYTKNPDEEVIEKMLKIADSLKAKVMGDDGEFYSEADLEGLRIGFEDARELSKQISIQKKPWWRFW